MPAGRASSRNPLKTSTAKEIARTTSTTPMTAPAETITTPLPSPPHTDPPPPDAPGAPTPQPAAGPAPRAGRGRAMRPPGRHRVRSLGGALDLARLSAPCTCSVGLDDPVDS